MNIIDISRDALKTEIYPGDPLPHAEFVSRIGENSSSTALTGFPTILGAVLGFTVGAMGPVALSVSLSFASGAMLYVVFGELMPESILMWRSKLPAAATVIGMLTGLVIIYV